MKVKDLWIAENLRQDCQFYRSMKSWERTLAQADPADTSHIAYLRDKLSTARAVVEARTRAGKYQP
jgi:hypothetical protein